ncbi:MAG: histidine phosphatase family protein [Candidatus Pacebacteria bacterium]|nr:histidine phosphatase family protein [Candidatus Paceibacterota bacterium]
MSELKHIYLVRHGRSRANETGIREGTDSPLAVEGEKQAAFVAERFKSIPIQLVLSSHYKRAEDTGRKIAAVNNVPFELVNMAHERELPIFTHGKHRNDPMVMQAVAQFEYSWIHDANIDDGEHFKDIKQRVVELSRLLEERPEQHIVVTSHGFFTKFFVAYHILGDYLTPDLFVHSIMTSLRSANTGITYFTVDEKKKWILSAWNDHAHLGELNSGKSYKAD